MTVGEGHDSDRATRRRVLASAGAVAAAGVAGCRSSEADRVKHSPEVFGYAFPYAVEDVQLNPWAAGSYPWDCYTLFFEAASVRAPGGARQPTDLVASVSVDGTRATVEYAEGFSWWSGDPVTARDRWVYERIQSHVGEDDRPDVELLDEYTIAYEFDRPLAEPLVLDHVLGHAVNTPAWEFEQWVDRFERAEGPEARARVADDLRERQISLSEAAEIGLGCGPYELVEASMSRLMLERYGPHPRADAVTVPRVWLPVAQSMSYENFVANGVLDGGQNRLDQLKASPPTFVEQLDQYYTAGGVKLSLDWRNDHLARRGVRRAILAAIPVPDVVSVGGMGEPASPQTGMAEPEADRWLDQSARADLREYPLAADTERAAAFMRAAGYERDGNDEWRDPDGYAVEFRLRTPMWRDWKQCGQLIAQSLSGFGFDVDFTQVSNTRLVHDVETNNYDALLWPSDGVPFRLYDVTATGASVLGYGVTDADATTSVHGKPVTVTVPTGDGDRREVNLFEQWRRLSGRTDRATTADAVATFARWWNHALPDLEIATGVSGVWGNTRDFAWPDDAAALRATGPADRPVIRALKAGLVGPA